MGSIYKKEIEDPRVSCFASSALEVRQGPGPIAVLGRLKLAAAGKGHLMVSITCCYLEILISCPAIGLLSSLA